MSGGARCCFGFMVFLAQILLHGVVGLVLFWVIMYHSKDGQPFAWRKDPDLEWNLHPVLMILGFIYFMGQGNYWLINNLVQFCPFHEQFYVILVTFVYVANSDIRLSDILAILSQLWQFYANLSALRLCDLDHLNHFDYFGNMVV